MKEVARGGRGRALTKAKGERVAEEEVEEVNTSGTEKAETMSTRERRGRRTTALARCRERNAVSTKEGDRGGKGG